MAFKDETSAFFDELSKIIDMQTAGREQGALQGEDRPFSSMLTQDEEPVTPQEEVLHNTDPEMISRYGMGY